MFNRFALLSLVLAATAVVPAAAQDAPPNAKMAGNWEMSFTSPQGPSTWKLSFQQVGDTLTGQAESEFGTLPLYSTEIKGNALSFSLTLSFNGQAIDLHFSGTVRGDAADGTFAVPMAAELPPIAWTAKRLASQA